MAQQVNATIQIVDLDEGAGADQYFDYGQGVGWKEAVLDHTHQQPQEEPQP